MIFTSPGWWFLNAHGEPYREAEIETSRNKPGVNYNISMCGYTGSATKFGLGDVHET